MKKSQDWMIPPHERFDPAYLPIRQIDLRLEMKNELIVGECFIEGLNGMELRLHDKGTANCNRGGDFVRGKNSAGN